jgi:hypothetical protein
MNQSINPRRMRASFVMFGASVVALLVVYATAAILNAWRLREQTPRLAADSLVKALRTHHRQTGRFPSDFRELEGRVWKHKNVPDFGADGRSLSVANYYYLLPSRGRAHRDDLDHSNRAEARGRLNPLSPAYA